MLRGRLPDKDARYEDPIYGIDLRSSLDDLRPGFAKRLSNCYFEHGLQKRRGSKVNYNAVQTYWGGATMPKGAYRFYFTDHNTLPAAQRLVAIGTEIWKVADDGTRSILNAPGGTPEPMTAGKDTHFQAWSITDVCYVSNGSNALRKWVPQTGGGAGSWWQPGGINDFTGTNIPASPIMLRPYLDRLFAIQGDVVVVTNPRVDNVWSPTNSSWAAYRPAGSPGRPIALHLHSSQNEAGDPNAVLLIFKSSSVTALRGSNFGADVTLASPPVDWDADLTTLAPNIGTLSPYAIVTVPDLGTFWLTQDRHIAWLPFGESQPRIISDRLWAPNREEYGLSDINMSQISQAQLVYHDRKLKLFAPVCSLAFNCAQWWLDTRVLLENPRLGYVWSGPHTGQSLVRVWTEDHNGDGGRLYGLEGDSTIGAYFYELDAADKWSDALGQTKQPVLLDYHTYYNGFGAESLMKWMPSVKIAHQGDGNEMRLGIRDLHGGGVQLDGLRLNTTDRLAFVRRFYGTGKFGTGQFYSDNPARSLPFTGHRQGEVRISDQRDGMEVEMDRIGLRITHGADGPFRIDAILPEVKLCKTQPVT